MVFRRATATVTTSAGDALLSVADPSPTATGHLVTRAYSKTLTFTLSTTTP